MSLLETGEISKVESFITIGDEYSDKREVPLHTVQGVRQFQTTGGVKTGQTGADWGEGYRSVKPLYQEEKYEDIAKLAVRDKMKSRERFLEPRGFVPSSPARQRTGPGTYDGAFTKYEHMDEGTWEKRGIRKKKDLEVLKKNLLTSPSKKGGFGFAGTTIAPRPAYSSEPYGKQPASRKQEEEDDSGRPPFKSASAPRATLDTAEHSATAASSVYRRDDRCLPPKPDPTASMTKKELVEQKAASRGYEKPFVQSHPAKSGYNCTFNKFPEAPREKYDPKVIQRALQPSRLAPAKIRKKKISAKLVDRPAFKPSSGSKSRLSRSIAHAGYHVATAGMRRSMGRRR